MISRRGFLLGTAASGLLAAAARRAGAQGRRSRLVILASGGGPRPRKDRGSTAHALVVDNVLYVVDCGNGVARQLVQAGVPLPSLRHVFITHHHSDHNADYGNLMLLAWTTGLRGRIDSWGPPPLEKMTRLFFEMNAYDIDTRIADEGRVPLVPLVHPHEISQGGPVMQDERVKVTAALVEHPPVTPAFAYRFDGPDRAIVFSGDTNKSDNLVRLARGADVLVHEAMYLPAVDRLVARVPQAATLKKHLIDSHTSAEDAGRVAAAAGVKTLVLSHLVPADDPLVTDQMWLDAARPHFAGEILVARDGLEL
ncbi:MAG TPA: MBL fold metallo-hydrolase [Methylomirabilota bacterium]|jgi:ribonuclease BN (tRNA processing enzyme)